MLKVTNITKYYRKKLVLDRVSFDLQPGEILGIVGHNGSGKSTLLSIIAQVVNPDQGQVSENEQIIWGDRNFMRDAMGYVPQSDGLPVDLTVKEILQFWHSLYGLKGPLFSGRDVLDVLGLQGIAQKRIGTLSGGMQKRLSIGLALMHHPRYLLMDEALSSLDRHYRLALLDWLQDFCDLGGAVVYCSHELESIFTLCHRIMVLRSGKVAFYGDLQDFPKDKSRLDVLLNPIELDRLE